MWLPEDFPFPRHVELPTGHHLRPIREADVDIDFPAVMGSQARLWTIFGDAWGWPPPDMTREDDRVDLARHEREIEARQSFNYAVLAADEASVLGCIYVDPPAKAGSDAEVCWWVVDELVGSPLDDALETFVPAWLAAAWPFEDVCYIGRDLTWSEWAALPEHEG
jgi:hypothetical protein